MTKGGYKIKNQEFTCVEHMVCAEFYYVQFIDPETEVPKRCYQLVSSRDDLNLEDKETNHGFLLWLLCRPPWFVGSSEHANGDQHTVCLNTEML